MPFRNRIAILVVAFALPLTGQQIAPVPKLAPVAPAAEKKIVLDVVVGPKSGKSEGSTGGLQQGDFTVLDNKVPRAITLFRPLTGTEAPIEVILLVDAVNTNYENIAFERQQIEKFLKADAGHLALPTALAVLTDTGIKLQPGFSTDGKALSDSLDQYTVPLRSIRRSAGFYGAGERLELSLNALRELSTREATRPGRKIVLWVSPGWPLLSGPGVQLTEKEQRQIFADIVGLSTSLRRSRITLYSVDPLGARESVGRTFYYEEFLKGIVKPSQTELGDLALEVLATQSGGLALNSNNDVTAMLQRCMADAAAYYELSFDAPESAQQNEYHHVEVQVDKPGFVARTREGYYAQPETSMPEKP